MDRTAMATLMALLPMGLWSQTVDQPKFEVASIKPSKAGLRGGSMEFSPSGERFTMTNMPLGALILVAYDITVRQLSGNLDAMTEHYDIAAKSDRPVSRDDMLRMIQALLADRFNLVLRRESKDAPVYALTVAPGGPKLRHSAPAEGERTMPRIPARAAGAESKGQVVFTNESMEDFASALTRMNGIGDRVVVDNTELPGNYDFTLTFVRDTAPSEAAVPATIPDGPSLFVAVQEQLGLKLEAKRAPVEFLIVEHIEKPSEN